jgi:pimeloyl-ACP methyl ester carboxylesterase
LNTVDSLRAGMSWVRVLVSYLVWILRTRRFSYGRARAGDIDIFYKRFGQGDPVLLVHGGFMVCESWVAQVRDLAGGYDVITMDSRGHGRTTLGVAPLSYRQLGRDLAAFIERLEIGPVNVVGTSDGGIASIALALERPELVHSMVLLGTSFNVSNYSLAAWRSIEEFLRPYSGPLLFVRAVRTVLSPERWRWREFYQGMREMWLTQPDFTVEDLAGIDVPTVVVGCDRDEFLSQSDDPLAVFKQTARAMPNARLVVIPGGSHTVNLDMPATVNNIIMDFLAELPSRFESDFSRTASRGRSLL